MKKQCDALDGVADGLIQNPAACNFRPERDLPRCEAGQSGDQCFTQAQAETAMVSGVTDERGTLVQPSYSVSELDVLPQAMQMLADPTLKIFVYRNDPGFKPTSIFSFARGGAGGIADFHAVVPSAEVAKAKAALKLGAGHLSENSSALMKSKAKLLMWHNSSDDKLTPWSSVN